MSEGEDEPSGESSGCDAIETIKGISSESIPSFARSSGAIGGKSGGDHPYEWVASNKAGVVPYFVCLGRQSCQCSNWREDDRERK